MTIEEMALRLRLPYIRFNYKEAIELAEEGSYGYEEFLEQLLANECEMRGNNRIRKNILRAHFPYKISLQEFKTAHFPLDLQRQVKKLASLEFIDNKENVILIGNPGTGKTALSIALGMEAIMKGKSVLFVNVPNLLLEIKEVMGKNEVTRFRKKFENYDLVIVDELGYCTFDRSAGEVLFNLLSNRNEKGSIIITSNLLLKRWKEVFNDVVLTTAMVDRLAYKAYLLDMTGESYRIRETRQWQEGKKEDGDIG